MIKQPSGIVQMTNVAIIRYRLNNKHFEIACYKNKAINWRNGQEKNIEFFIIIIVSEVLQIDKIFTSASHGQIASNGELKGYFGDISKKEIVKIILDKGELQIGEKERDVQLEQIFKGIVKFIQEKCVHSEFKRPFNLLSIEHAIGKTNFIVKPDQAMKKQALQCIKLLQEQFCIQRAEMKVSITIRQEDNEKLLKTLKELEVPEESMVTTETSVQAVMDPSIFRPLSQILKDEFPKSLIEVIDANISNREIVDIELSETVELEVRKDRQPIKPQVVEKKYEKEEKHEKIDKKTKNKLKLQMELKKKKELENQVQTQQTEDKKIDPVQDNSDKEFKCSMCKGACYDTQAEFRQHYKSDWHNFNLKLKTKGQAMFSNEEYLEKILDEEQMKL